MRRALRFTSADWSSIPTYSRLFALPAPLNIIPAQLNFCTPGRTQQSLLPSRQPPFDRQARTAALHHRSRSCQGTAIARRARARTEQRRTAKNSQSLRYRRPLNSPRASSCWCLRLVQQSQTTPLPVRSARLARWCQTHTRGPYTFGALLAGLRHFCTSFDHHNRLAASHTPSTFLSYRTSSSFCYSPSLSLIILHSPGRELRPPTSACLLSDAFESFHNYQASRTHESPSPRRAFHPLFPPPDSTP